MPDPIHLSTEPDTQPEARVVEVCECPDCGRLAERDDESGAWCCTGGHSWTQPLAEPLKLVVASEVKRLEEERDDLKELAHVPHECICGANHDAGAMASPKPPGPDCRPLMWKEKADQARQNAIARRNEGRRALARTGELEQAIRDHQETPPVLPSGTPDPVRDQRLYDALLPTPSTE